MDNTSKLSDEKLVKLICADNKELYAKIIKRYQNKLTRYAFYLTGDDYKADDVVQNAFIKAYINLNSFNINKKFSSWIYRITHNEAMNMLNKNKKQIFLDKNIDFDSGINLEDNLISQELRSTAKDCLGKIAVIYREPLSLYFIEEKSYEEISDILRLPIGTVATRISRAKLIMKKICQKQLK